MKIYIAHSKSFDFQKELYNPIKNSPLFKEHSFIFPHEENREPFSSKEFFQEDCDLIIAEVSYPAIGLGIELGWASMLNIPILCIYKKGSKITDSLKSVTNEFLEYSNSEELLIKIKEAIKTI
jgi:nucleoside 2-deoxyribosyltransferase